MKVSKRMKKTVLVTVVVIGLLLIACGNLIQRSTSSDTRISNVVNTKKWQVKAPQLFGNVGYSKLIESNSNSNYSNTNQSGYIGKVTNPFGIRDDVLEFILNYFPKNESAVYAAIRMEQYDVLIYRSQTPTEAVGYANADSVPIWCLSNAIGFINANKYLNQLEKKELSTPEGKKVDQDSRKKLGWKIFGTAGKTKQQLDTLCINGGY